VASSELDVSTRAGQEALKSRGIRPIPEPDELTQPYWDAAARSELRLQRCVGCNAFHHPPVATCSCGSTEHEWTQVSGNGTVYTFIVDHRNMVPGFYEPYVVAQINPDETQDNTVRITGNIRDCDTSDVTIGLPVEVFFEEVNGVTLPQFRPRS
jgi:uncharacterized protein